MHIVAGVTVHAAPWRAAGEVTQRSGVAVVAREVLVGAGQMEMGLRVVVEPPPLPTIGVMTAAAVLAEVCVVIVVGRERRPARTGQDLEELLVLIGELLRLIRPEVVAALEGVPLFVTEDDE